MDTNSGDTKPGGTSSSGKPKSTPPGVATSPKTNGAAPVSAKDAAAAAVEKLTLRRGNVEMTAHCSGKGPDVILVHGFPDSFTTWRYQHDTLVAAGYRVTTPCLRGYEGSSADVNADYYLTEMADDLMAWCDKLGAEQPHIVGHDWGSAICQIAAARHPKRFASLSILAVPHMSGVQPKGLKRIKQMRNFSYQMVFKVPKVAEQRCTKNDFAYLKSLWRRWSPNFSPSDADFKLALQQFKNPAVLTSALRYYRHNLNSSADKVKSTNALLKQGIPVPTLAIAGREDGCVDYQFFMDSMKSELFPKGMQTVSIDGAGHFMHLEKHTEVNRALLDWFQRHPPGPKKAKV